MLRKDGAPETSFLRRFMFHDVLFFSVKRIVRISILLSFFCLAVGEGRERPQEGIRAGLKTGPYNFCLAAAEPSAAKKMNIPAEAREGLQLLYSGDTQAAIEQFKAVQKAQPASPVGYLLEVDALWWRIYAGALEIKWNTVEAWKRARIPDDDYYLALAERAIQAADAEIKKQDSAEMRFYAGMGWALEARLYGLRDERRAVARAGVHAREHFLRAIELDPNFGDAYMGLGLYNYYVDTLSSFAKFLRFFMGIPGGNKVEGIAQLERAMRDSDVTLVEARFYLAKNMRNYERNYARGVELMTPLVEQFPRNPIFRLILGDMHAKLGHTAEASAQFAKAQEFAGSDPATFTHVRQIAAQAMEMIRKK